MYGVVQVGKTEAPYLSLSPPPHPPPPPPSFTSVVNNKISPSVLLIIIILAVIFFVSGLLHLLVRFLFRPSIRDPEELDHVTALQGQLQQLFDLHDSGVDQSFIDTLPVFLYKAIIGIKNPFDCAVCLCEFEADDKLRLLPKCSHAFHVECIDTWLLSHSTCPLCRGTLLPDFFPNSNCSPVVFVLESGSESSREIVADRETVVAATNTTLTQLGVHGEDEFGHSSDQNSQKCVEVRDDTDQGADSVAKVVQVKLGKFRNVDGIVGGEGSTSSTSNVDGRRCFSMGSYEYVLDDTSSLQVSIKPSTKKQGSKKPSLPLTPGHRQAMSECDCHSSRFQGFDRNGDASIRISGNNTNAKVGKSKRESISGSKIWLRGKEKTSTGDSSRRALSFRLPLHKTGADESKSKAGANRTTCSDMDVEEWENHGSSEVDCFEEVGNCSSLESHPRSQSFAMRTLLWFVGRHNKVMQEDLSQRLSCPTTHCLPYDTLSQRIGARMASRRDHLLILGSLEFVLVFWP